MDELHDFVKQTMEEGFQNLHRNHNAAHDALKVQNEKSLREIEVLHAQLHEAKNEGYQELLKRQKAEQDADEAEQRAQIAEILLTKETRERRDAQNTLMEERLEMNRLKEQLDEALEKISLLENEVINLNSMLDEMLRDQHEAGTSHRGLESEPELEVDPSSFIMFTRNELIEATSNFSQGLKIGSGGLGSVYKGWVETKMVAIKVLKEELLHQNNFLREGTNYCKLVKKEINSFLWASFAILGEV